MDTIDEKQILIKKFGSEIEVEVYTDQAVGMLDMVVTMEQAKKLFKDLLRILTASERKSYNFSTDREVFKLKLRICEEFKLKDPKYLNIRTRKASIKTARQLLFSILKWNNYGSLSEIADTVGGRHHATVLHAVKVILNYLETHDEKYYQPIINVLNHYNLPYPIKQKQIDHEEH